MENNELRNALLEHRLDDALRNCCAEENVSSEIERYTCLLEKAVNQFGEGDYALFSAPGRSEIGGNHTDHQRGKVLGAALNVDIAAVVKKCEGVVEFISEGFQILPIDLNDLSFREEEKNTSLSLIKGILARMKELGYHIGGFQAYSDSKVPQGFGLSSSACFEVLIGKIISCLYNEDRLDPIMLAKIGQYAENTYFGKPCGLLDQMVCAVGGFVFIDFKDPKIPLVETIDYDFSAYGYSLCLVNTQGSHAHLSSEYAKMPEEMKQVAHLLGKEVLSECTKEEVLSNISQLRCALENDRALLRAFHFFDETKRAKEEADALKSKNIDKFFQLILASGNSSYMYLQNVYLASDVFHQPLSLALCLSEQILRNKGAWRVHGGGLAGTIQAFVPNDLLDSYVQLMEKVYGKNACFAVKIRNCGVVRIA